MIIKRVYLILLLAIFFSSTLFALDPGLAVTQYVLDTWTVDDGLPQNTASCIIQTHDGYLWVGTGNGLARFDGARFTVFNLFNTKELTDHDIRGFFEDRNKNLWITSTEGFNRYSNGKFENFSGQEELMDRIIFTLLENKQGTLWIGTNKGLLRFLNGRFEKFSGEEALVEERVINLYEDRQNNLWIGTDRYLFRFRDRPF